MRYPYHPQILLSGTMCIRDARPKSAIRRRIMLIILVTPLLISTIRRQDGHADFYDTGLPTHPLTAIPAAATPQRLYYSDCPLNTTRSAPRDGHPGNICN